MKRSFTIFECHVIYGLDSGSFRLYLCIVIFSNTHTRTQYYTDTAQNITCGTTRRVRSITCRRLDWHHSLYSTLHRIQLALLFILRYKVCEMYVRMNVMPKPLHAIHPSIHRSASIRCQNEAATVGRFILRTFSAAAVVHAFPHTTWASKWLT